MMAVCFMCPIGRSVAVCFLVSRYILSGTHLVPILQNKAIRCITRVHPPVLQCSVGADVLWYLHEHRLVWRRRLLRPVLLRPIRDPLPACPTGSPGTPAAQRTRSVFQRSGLLPVITAVQIQRWDIRVSVWSVNINHSDGGYEVSHINSKHMNSLWLEPKLV